MRLIWPTVKTAIKSRIPDHSYRMWIESLGFVEERDTGVVISCPNTFFQKKIQTQYHDLIEEELQNACGTRRNIIVTVAGKERDGHTSKAARASKGNAGLNAATGNTGTTGLNGANERTAALESGGAHGGTVAADINGAAEKIGDTNLIEVAQRIGAGNLNGATGRPDTRDLNGAGGRILTPESNSYNGASGLYTSSGGFPGIKRGRQSGAYGSGAANTGSRQGGRQLSLPGVNTRLQSGRMLRRGFTFDKFVVGGNNDFAYSAALSLAAKRNASNSALFLLSQTGMGKSHLSQAIGHHILAANPTDNVYYVTAEDFTNEMVRSFKEGTIDSFKEKFRTQCDVLLLEDVHFLTGKERTQVELAMTLDYLFEADKKIIFSSCYLPGDIPKMNDQLRSRLSSGLISNIETPDFKTRFKILQNKSKECACHVPLEVTEFLAGELTENVRQLESGLIGVTAKSSLLGVPLDLGLAESVVKNIAQKKKSITIGSIKKLVCEAYKITEAEIVSKSRKQAVVRPRQMAMYLARKYTDQPLQAIGRSFNRYHATAIHAIGAVEKELKVRGAVSKQYEYLTKKLQEGRC